MRKEKENDIPACVARAMDDYFRDLDGEVPAGIYDMVMACVEQPLLEQVLLFAEGNQTRAAEYLGINRNTLRKKMGTVRNQINLFLATGFTENTEEKYAVHLCELRGKSFLNNQDKQHGIH